MLSATDSLVSDSFVCECRTHEIAAEFLPPGVLNVVCGDVDMGRALVAHDIPQLVSITGSVRAGIQVAQAAAGRCVSAPVMRKSAGWA